MAIESVKKETNHAMAWPSREPLANDRWHELRRRKRKRVVGHANGDVKNKKEGESERESKKPYRKAARNGFELLHRR